MLPPAPAAPPSPLSPSPLSLPPAPPAPPAPAVTVTPAPIELLCVPVEFVSTVHELVFTIDPPPASQIARARATSSSPSSTTVNVVNGLSSSAAAGPATHKAANATHAAK